MNEKEVLEDMVWQFAYRGVKSNKSILYTGGLSALESAFECLGWQDPHEIPDYDGVICDVKGCAEFAVSQGCAWKRSGYWIVCRQHSQDARDGKRKPAMKKRAIEREARRDPVTGCLPVSP